MIFLWWFYGKFIPHLARSWEISKLQNGEKVNFFLLPLISQEIVGDFWLQASHEDVNPDFFSQLTSFFF